MIAVLGFQRRFQVPRQTPNHRRHAALGMRFLSAAVLLASAAVAQAAGEPPVLASPAAGTTTPRTSTIAAGPERSLNDWLQRMRNATGQRAYVGTFVVLSAAGGMYSSRIWHACSGDVQMERIDSLTGPPRITLRRNEQVITFMPDLRVARAEKRESTGVFPNLQRADDSSLSSFYQIQPSGVDRVAGFDADVVLIQPKDGLRFGYRIWSEKKSGLVLKIQTLDTDNRVLEQAAFSELELDASVRMDKLAQMMANTAGYRLDRPEMVKTTALDEGWVLKGPVTGFLPVSCYRRVHMPATTVTFGPQSPQVPDSILQWTFSDGLATVSLFIEPYERLPHPQDEVHASMGATQTLAKRVAGDWWLTLVGEVPQATLRLFAQNLERRKP